MEDEKKPEVEEKSEDKKEEKEDVEKSVISALSTLTDTITNLNDRVEKKFEYIEGKIKAMEEPTDLPLKPKNSDSEDIGDKVSVPDTYQSNSQQASIDDSDPKNENEKDPGELKMQEKTQPQKVQKSAQVDTFTPWPSGQGGVQNILKSEGNEMNPLLADAREVGFEGLSVIAKNIMSGNYGSPEQAGVY